MPRLVDFLFRLANDPDALANFQRDPQGFVSGASELTDKQRALLLSGDAHGIQHVIEYELGGKLPDDAVLGVVVCGVIALFAPDETTE